MLLDWLLHIEIVADSCILGFEFDGLDCWIVWIELFMIKNIEKFIVWNKKTLITSCGSLNSPNESQICDKNVGESSEK